MTNFGVDVSFGNGLQQRFWLPTTTDSEFTEEDYDEEQYSHRPPELVPSNEYIVPICGFIYPPVILFTVLTNSVICLILLKKSMRSSTNTLLVGIAFSDMLTGLIPLPSYIYFYTLGYYKEWIPYLWCRPYVYFTDFTPTVFHTASIWLTVALAVQRYFYICRPTLAKHWCTVANAVKAVSGVYFAALLSQICRYVEVAFQRTVMPSRLDNIKNVTACFKGFNYPFIRDLNSYFNIYWWSRVVLIHMIPCLTLTIFNALLIHAMRTAQKRRRQLLKQNRRTECRRLAENNLTTLMLVAVVGVFLVVEFPLALLLIVMILDNSFYLAILSQETRELSQAFINLCILLSYPLNFFIYCGMSRTFRQIFKGFFFKTYSNTHQERIDNATVTMHNVIAVMRSDAKDDRCCRCCSGRCRDQSLSLRRQKMERVMNEIERTGDEDNKGSNDRENLLAQVALLNTQTAIGESADEKTVYIELNG